MKNINIYDWLGKKYKQQHIKSEKYILHFYFL